MDVDKAYRKLEQTKMLVLVANEVLALQKENLRISGNRIQAGTIIDAKYSEAIAFAQKAEADVLQATLAYELAVAEIKRIAGADETPD